MSCHVYDVDKSLHDKAPSYHTTCGCQHDFFGEFSHCSNKKKPWENCTSFFFSNFQKMSHYEGNNSCHHI